MHPSANFPPELPGTHPIDEPARRLIEPPEGQAHVVSETPVSHLMQANFIWPFSHHS